MTIRIRRPKIGITLRLFLLFASVGLIPISVMSFYTYWQINRQVAFEVDNNLANVGLRLRDDVGRTVADLVGVARSAAEAPIFADPKAARTDVEREMRRLRARLPDVAGLYLLKGSEIAAGDGPSVFASGDIDLLAFSAPPFHVESPRPFPDNGHPALLVSLRLSEATGAPPRVLLVALGTRVLSDAAQLVRIGESGRAYILDGSGRTIAGPNGTELFTPFAGEAVSRRISTVGEGVIHYVDAQGDRHIAFVAKVPNDEGAVPEGLRVLITSREDEAYLVADQIGNSIGLAVVLILMATSLFSFALSQSITRPIKEIIRGTERVGAGDFSHEITVRSRDEIGELAGSFNRMAWELAASHEFMENYNRELERQVGERSQRLEESEKKYRTVVEGTGDGWTVLDEKLTIRFANQQLARMLGKSPGRLAGTSLGLFLPAGEEARVREAAARALAGPASPVLLSFRASGKGGRQLVLQGAFSAMPEDEMERRVIAHLADRTELATLAEEKERLQLELMERSKHSQIGIMTEGLFHNLNNPLQALMGILKVVSQDIRQAPGTAAGGGDGGDQAQIVRDVDEAFAVARKLSDQVKNLLMKIRNESRRRIEPIDVNSVVRAEVAFLEADLFFKHKVVKRLDLADGLPALPGVYSDLSQSFVNIILNAVDAMRGSEVRELSITTSMERKKIRVAFHDTGHGIDEAHIPRIFDPFFTTKSEAQQGTGLGLFTVDFLLKPYRVTYRVTSRPGDTTLTLLFPVRGLSEKGESAPGSAKGARGGRGRMRT